VFILFSTSCVLANDIEVDCPPNKPIFKEKEIKI